MHQSLRTNEKGICNRQGSLYRSYADNKLDVFYIAPELVVDDIINICMVAPIFRCNKHNGAVLIDIKRHFKIKGALHNDDVLTSLIIVVFNFGFMQGGKAVRDKQKGKNK